MNRFAFALFAKQVGQNYEKGIALHRLPTNYANDFGSAPNYNFEEIKSNFTHAFQIQKGRSVSEATLFFH